MEYRTVFDASEPDLSTWTFLAIGLPLVLLGVFMVCQPALIRRLMPFAIQKRFSRVFGWCFLVFTSGWMLAYFAGSYVNYETGKTALREGRFDVIEGTVADFVPTPRNGKSPESFAVGGHRFSYSEYAFSSGFHTTAFHGGPIRPGLHVRVSYVGDLILRLEIAE